MVSLITPESLSLSVLQLSAMAPSSSGRLMRELSNSTLRLPEASSWSVPASKDIFFEVLLAIMIPKTAMTPAMITARMIMMETLPVTALVASALGRPANTIPAMSPLP